MKILKSELNDVKKKIKSLKYFPFHSDNTSIVFPIEFGSKDLNGIQLDVVNKGSGSTKMPELGLRIVPNDESPNRVLSQLVLCDFTFAKKLDFVSICDLVGTDLSKKEEEFFNQLDCFLVFKENLYAEF